MLIADDYPLLDVIWTMLVFFAWVIWFWILITVLSDLFRRHDVSGWGKAAWTLFVIVLPFLGVLVYLGTQGKGMAERHAKAAQAQQAQVDDYVRSVAGGPTGEIAKAKELLDTGAISQAEFDQIKQRALA
ncbi:MAG TPA: SHOCT domain-containing protein [Thermoleophilaceae bacterium]|nr:SHOCT domain-containing protein [Thermoleophilaceae bacterium]